EEERQVTIKAQTGKPSTFIGRYVFSRDHKIIGLQYFFLALAAALVGSAMSLLMRLRLAWPRSRWPLLETVFPGGFQDGLMKPEFYLAMVTMHGTIMIFMVLSVAPQSAFGNYFLPIQLGAREMVFPRLNMTSFWLTLASFVVLMSALFVAGGAPIGGWTFYPPLSAVASAGAGAGGGRRSVADQRRHFLPGVVSRLDQLHRHDAHAADEGNVPDANAVDLLGMVHGGLRLAARFPGLAHRVPVVIPRSQLRDEF